MLIIWGWGKKGKEVPLGPTSRLVMQYTYFHIFWFLTAAWGRKYQLATWTETGWALEPLTAERADAFCGGQAPDISAWKKFSLLGFAVLILLLVALTV